MFFVPLLGVELPFLKVLGWTLGGLLGGLLLGLLLETFLGLWLVLSFVF
jgi:hypothetical protein